MSAEMNEILRSTNERTDKSRYPQSRDQVDSAENSCAHCGYRD